METVSALCRVLGCEAAYWEICIQLVEFVKEYQVSLHEREPQKKSKWNDGGNIIQRSHIAAMLVK